MHSAKPYLIIVTGRPAAGKSSLASWLSKKLNVPLVSKDSIREILFDQLGWQDRAWARQLGRASIDLIFYFAQTQLESSHSLIMDNAFHPALSTPRFSTLKAQTGAALIQIVCDAKSEVLRQRFKQRAEAGNRHPGHGDADVYDELWQNLSRNLCLL